MHLAPLMFSIAHRDEQYEISAQDRFSKVKQPSSKHVLEKLVAGHCVWAYTIVYAQTQRSHNSGIQLQDPIDPE